MNVSYEFMVLVASATDMTSDKTQMDLVQKLVGGTVTVSSVTNLGKKQLAYPIKKQDEATYLVASLTGMPLKMSDIESKAKLMDDVIRFMLTVK